MSVAHPSRTRVALVTGAGSGIGLATALHLAAREHRVFAFVRSEGSATGIRELAEAEGVGVDVVFGDVRDGSSVTRSVDAVLAETGRIDLLVNSAGIAATGVVEDTPPDRYAELFDVNVLGAVRTAQAVLPAMRAAASGVIVNVSSSAGRVAMVAQSAYVTSKWALEGLTESLAAEVAQFGVRIALVEPGVTRSPIFATTSASDPLPPRGGPYDATYRRMLRYYKRAAPQAAPAHEVAEAVWQAAYGAGRDVRTVCSWGGSAMIDGRAAMSAEEWVALNALERDADYYDEFEARFGIALH